MSPARALAVLSALLLVTGCPRKQEAPPAAAQDAGPAQRAEVEPDDRPEQSMAVGESTDVTASLSSTPARADEDWYLLFGDRPRAVDVTVSGIPGTAVLLEAYDETRTRLAAVSAEAEGQPVRFPNLTVRGKLLLRVSAARKGGGGAYTLSVRYGDPRPGTEVEPNDRHADATELQPQGDAWTIQGLYGSPGDEDHFRIVLDSSVDGGPAGPGSDAGGAPAAAAPPGAAAPVAAAPPAPAEPPPEEGFPTQPPPLGGTRGEADAGVVVQEPPRVALRIELSGVQGVRPEVQILSEAEATLFTTRGTEGQPLSQRNVAVRATDRVIDVVVKSAWTGTGKEARRGFDPEHPYTLTVSREAAGANAEFEPNDDLAHATPLPLDGYREGFLTPKTDVDYYVVRPAAAVAGPLRAQRRGEARSPALGGGAGGEAGDGEGAPALQRRRGEGAGAAEQRGVRQGVLREGGGRAPQGGRKVGAGVREPRPALPAHCPGHPRRRERGARAQRHRGPGHAHSPWESRSAAPCIRRRTWTTSGSTCRTAR